MRRIAAAAGALVALVALGGCNREGPAGYVEIKTPSGGRPLALYIDADKVEAAKGGVAVLRQPVGTAKLQIDGEAGKVVLCQLVVKKNRITTVTVSSLDRPPRCQCGRPSGTDAASSRTCIG